MKNPIRSYLAGIAASLATVVSLASCSHAEIDEDYCLRDGYEESVRISLSVSETLDDYKTIRLVDEDARRKTRGTLDWKYRYTVNVYREDSNELVATLNTLDPLVSLQLPLGKYRAIAWADNVYGDRLESAYFHTSDFSDILLKEKYSYDGNDFRKRGFLGKSDFTVSYRTPVVNINLSSAMGYYRIIATDSADYEVGKVVVGYPKGLPASLDALNDRICHYWMGVDFEDNHSDAVAADFIFGENEEKSLFVKIQVYDVDGHLRARRNAIEIPYIRGGRTTVKGKIFTVLESNPDDGNEGGVGIDDDYDNTWEIVITR